MGLRVIAIGEFASVENCISDNLSRDVLSLDTGKEKKDLALSLGAEKWIDFKESKDLVQDIKDATEGLGPHATIVTAASVRLLRMISSERF